MPQQDGRRCEIAFRIKPLTHQRCSEGSNKAFGHQDPETLQRLRENCVWVSLQRYWSSVHCYKGRGSGCSILGYGISPLGRGYHFPTIEPAKLTQTLGGHRQNLLCTRTQEKGAVTSQKIDSSLSMSVQESPMEVLVGGGLLQGGGHWVQ